MSAAQPQGHSPVSPTADGPTCDRPSDVFIARQPICDVSQNVVGYELLFRSGDTDRALFSDGDAATTQTLLNSLLNIGLDRLVGNKLAFVNVTRSYLTGKNPLPVPQTGIVLEVLEDEIIDEELIAGVASLREAGFTLAMDDVYDDERILRIIDHVQIVKLEYPALSEVQLIEITRKLSDYPIKILAEKIETVEDFEKCKRLGIGLFQGYYFARPQLVKGRKISSNHMRLLKILSILQDPNSSFEKIEELIRQDVAFAYKLLRYINSVSFGIRREIQSVKQAMTLLGLVRIRSLAMLLAMENANSQSPELMTTAMVRAKTCETIASINSENPEAAFTVGLFSLLDALLGVPMSEVLEHLPLADMVRDALLDGENFLSTILSVIKANESGNREVLSRYPRLANNFNNAYLDAIQWASLSTVRNQAS